PGQGKLRSGTGADHHVRHEEEVGPGVREAARTRQRLAAPSPPARSRELRDDREGNDARDRHERHDGRTHGPILLDSPAMRVAWLGEAASLDAAAVGGKTANLGRLATSFRVPPGFCLDVSAFDELRHALDGDVAARARLRELVAASYSDLASRVGER